MRIKQSTLLWGAFYLSVYIVLVETMLYFESFDPNSSLDTFGEGVWYSIVTVTSVGYGDYVPSTIGGKMIGSIFVLMSLVSFGLFVGSLTNYYRVMNENKKLGFSGTKFDNHTVIIGWDSFARTVADQLVEVGGKVAIITTQKDNVDIIIEHFHHNKNVFVLFSEFDNFDLLKNANIKKASMVFFNGKSDTENLVHLLNFKKRYKEPKFIVMLENGDLKDTFMSAGVTYTLSKHELSAKLMASYIFEPDVAEFGEELISNAKDETEYDIMMYRVIATNPYVNAIYDNVFFELKKKYNTILVGLSTTVDGEKVLYKNPDHEIKISIGDYLLVISNGKRSPEITELFGVEEGIV